MFLFSIIVPVYNAEWYLKQCLDSFHIDKYDTVQLILINDGSTDHSGDICRQYKTMYQDQVTYIDKKNAGVSAARNDGLAVATGKYILFYDSDDYVPDHYMSELLRITEQEADLYVYNYQVLEQNKQFSRHPDINNGYIELSDLCDKDIFEYLGYQVWNKIFLGKIIKENNLRFDTDMKWSEDLDFWVRYALYANTVYADNASLYIYRVNESGAVASTDIRALKNIQTAYRHQLDYLEKSQVNTDAYRYVVQSYAEHLCLTIFTCFRRNAALSELKNELKTLNISKDFHYQPISLSARFKMVCLRHGWLKLLIWYFRFRNN